MYDSSNHPRRSLTQTVFTAALEESLQKPLTRLLSFGSDTGLDVIRKPAEINKQMIGLI